MSKYRSYRGKIVDMEELRRKHEKTVASGNMGVNASGDTLGRGGSIIETAGSRTRKHYVSKETSKTSVSIKGDQENEKIFDEEKSKGSKPAGSNQSVGAESKTTATKRKVEKETEAAILYLKTRIKYL